MITQQEYAERRKRFAEQMQTNSIAFLSAADHPRRTYETEYTFRQDSDFYYLTGFSEPNAVAVITSDNEFFLFNQMFDPKMITWTGPMAGQEGATRDFGAQKSFPYQEFDGKLLNLLLNREAIYFPFNDHRDLQIKILEALDQLQYKVRFAQHRPSSIHNTHDILHNMRIVKSSAEIDTMAKITEISAQAHIRCMQTVKPGMYENQMEAEFIHYTMTHGARQVAYGSIVAGGANACILHYTANDQELKDGDLLLIDMGAELENYASDITRTYPVNGKFSEEQAALYNLVLKAQISCLDMAKPGITHQELHENSARIITEGLVELGLLQGDIATLLEEKEYRKFYMHFIGHWIGLDVHDRGLYFANNESRKFVPGMVVTVEPGIYIAPRTEGVDKKWWGIGIRIEDDVVITEKGNRVLSASVPKTIAEIEQLMNENQ